VSRDELWAAYCKKLPHLAAKDSTPSRLTTRGAYDLVTETWKHAYAAGVKDSEESNQDLNNFMDGFLKGVER